MPKLFNRPPKYSLHKPSGQAKVRYNGKTLYLGKHGTPGPALKPMPSSWPSCPSPMDRRPSPIRFRALCSWSANALRVLQEHAQTYYTRDGVPTGEHITIRGALRPLVKRFSELPVTEFGPKKLKQLREDMIELNWTASLHQQGDVHHQAVFHLVCVRGACPRSDRRGARRPSRDSRRTAQPHGRSPDRSGCR